MIFMFDNLDKKSEMTTVTFVVGLVIVLALGLVLLLVTGKIHIFTSKFVPTCGNMLGVKGKCACYYSDNECPGDTVAFKSDSCPPDAYGPEVCTDEAKMKKALKLAQKDKKYGNCCTSAPKGSIIEGGVGGLS